MMYLRMKINENIVNESLRIFHIFKNYSNLIKHFIDIKLHLRKINVLAKSIKHKSKNTIS